MGFSRPTVLAIRTARCSRGCGTSRRICIGTSIWKMPCCFPPPGLCKLSTRRFHTACDGIVVHGTVALAESQFVQTEMLELRHAGLFKGLACAVDGTAVDDEDPWRAFRDGEEVFHASADAGKARHFRHAL